MRAVARRPARGGRPPPGWLSAEGRSAPRDFRAPPGWTLTAALALAYLIIAPASPDLAAASYRSSLFAHSGFTIWDNSWYGGHHLPAYSLLAPAIGALLGPRLLAAISMTIAAALFTALIDGRFPARAVRIASLWFALGAGVSLLSSRVPFDLGLAIGLGSLLLAQHSRGVSAAALALACSLASPVAGAFLALGFLAWALAGPQRGLPAALCALALVSIALLALAFPEGGSQPFVGSAFFPALAGVLVITALIPRGHGQDGSRVLRAGGLLYALALIGAYLLSSAVGGNADRLGALAAGPLAACALVGVRGDRRRARILLALAPLLLYWQVKAPVSDFAAAASDPGVHASYYRPLLSELQRLDIGYGRRPARIEVVPLADHWEARWTAPHVMIARGWERQLDRYRDALFYEGSRGAKRIAPARYRAWLYEQSISYVALPDAKLDYSARAEAELLRAGPLPYLREVWHSLHWRLFAVAGARPLADPPSVLQSVGSDWLTLTVPRAGAYTVRVHYTRYWSLVSGSGCVSRAPGDWTRVSARGAGQLRLAISVSVARLFSDGPRCT